MRRITEVDFEQINRLSDVNLSKLLLKLLYLEYNKWNFPDCRIISVPLKINVGDGGEDGRIECSDVKESLWIKNKKTFFQIKASNLTPKKCKDEIIKSGKIKPRIRKILQDKGDYVLFMGHNCNGSGRDKRINAIKEAIEETDEIEHNDFGIRVLDSDLIKDWCNQYLSAIIFVHEITNIHIPVGVKTWDIWANNPSFEFSFKKNNELKGMMELIKRNSIESKNTRIIGLSGLGKSRLVFESFRPLKHNQKATTVIPKLNNISDSIVYFSIYSVDDENIILKFTKEYCSRYSAILIVDNCSFRLHQELNTETTRIDSRFTLITIDNELKTEDTFPPYHPIKLDNTIYKELVHEILQEEFKDKLDDKSIQQIGNYSEGFPQMAVLFARARFQGEDNLSNLLQDELMKKLVFGREAKNEKEFHVLKACAIPTSFTLPSNEIYDIYKKEVIQDLEKEARIIQEKFCEDVSWREFNKIVTKYLERGILERKGNHILLGPAPLALKLAVKWWEEIPYSEVRDLFNNLLSLKVSNSLGVRITDRLAQLDNLNEAKLIVKKLWGVNAPLSQAEVLNSNLGSRLFRSIVVVNPKAALQALIFNYDNLDVEKLKNINTGRRNIIWALEKLCFRKDTFFEASKLMMQFGVAETEHIMNNAVGQFCQLFKLYLSGTEVNYSKRVSVLKYGISKNDKAFDNIIISACNSGLDCDGFHRISGAELQGSSQPLNDYEPKSKTDIFSYWNEIFDILDFLLKERKHFKTRIEGVIISSLRCLFYFQYPLEKIEPLISKLVETDNKNWHEVTNELKITYKYENLSTEAKFFIKNQIRKLKPKDIPNILLSVVSKPTWERLEVDKQGNDITVDKLDIDGLILILKNENISFSNYLEYVLKGEQRKGFEFGKSYGQKIGYRESIIKKSISILENIEDENRNIAFLAGYISVINNKATLDEIYSRFLLNEKLKYQSFIIVKYIRPNLDDINKLFDLIENKDQITKFSTLEWGKTLETLSNNDIISLCERIENYKDEGKWVALGLIDRYIQNDEEKWTICKDYILKLVMRNEFLVESVTSIGNRRIREWTETVKKLLNENDIELVVSISNQFIERCKLKRYVGSDYNINSILDILIKNHFEQVWEIFGEYFIGEDISTYLNLEYSIADNGGAYSKKQLLFKHDYNLHHLLTWTNKHVPIAPLRLIKVAPLSIRDKNENLTWHPFTKELIDNYGSNESVMHRLEANLDSFSSVGSRVPYYEYRKKLCELLIGHKIEFVNRWAIYKVSYYEEKIISSRVEDEERSIE